MSSSARLHSCAFCYTTPIWFFCSQRQEFCRWTKNDDLPPVFASMSNVQRYPLPIWNYMSPIAKFLLWTALLISKQEWWIVNFVTKNKKPSKSPPELDITLINKTPSCSNVHFLPGMHLIKHRWANQMTHFCFKLEDATGITPFWLKYHTHNSPLAPTHHLLLDQTTR